MNPGSDALSYLSGLVTVPAYGSFDVPSGFWVRLYSDSGFLEGLRNRNISLNDSVTTFKFPASEDFIKYAISQLDFSAVRKDFSYTTTQTDTVIWTPATGKKFIVTDYSINIRNSTLGPLSVTIFDNTNAAGNILYKGNIESGANYDNVSNFVKAFESGAINRSLKITTSGNLIISGTVQGYETE